MVRLPISLRTLRLSAVLLFLVVEIICPVRSFAQPKENEWVKEIRREMRSPVSAAQMKRLTLLIRNIKNENVLLPQEAAWLKQTLAEEASRGEGAVDAIPQSVMLLEAVKLFSTDIRLRVKFAKTLTSLAQFQDAMKVLYDPVDPIFEKTTDPKGYLVFKDKEARVVAYAMQGCGVLAAGKVNEARQLYQMAIESDPGWSGVYYLMGVLEIGQKRLEVARKYLNKALELNPANEGAKDLLKTIRAKK